MPSVTHAIPGLVLTEHEFSAPLDHARPGGASIGVFAREVADPDGQDRPFLVFLQGGPGFEAARPTPSAYDVVALSLATGLSVFKPRRRRGRRPPTEEETA